MAGVKCLQDAIETLDLDIAGLTGALVDQALEMFCSVEEVESELWWKARRLAIELRKAREIRESLGSGQNGEDEPTEDITPLVRQTPKKKAQRKGKR